MSWQQSGEPVMLYLADGSLGRVEKNWSPIGDDSNTPGNFLFSRYIEPHQILSCSPSGACHVVGLCLTHIRSEPIIFVHLLAASTSNDEFFDNFMRAHGAGAIHLGTNAVRLSPTRYLSVLHTVHGSPPNFRPRTYGKCVHTFLRLRLTITYLLEQLCIRV